MSKPTLSEQEWSHFFDIDDLERNRPTELIIEADEEERADLSRRFVVEGMKSVTANLTLQKTAGIIHVKGRFTTLVTQKCVVSTDDFDTELSESVEGWFADKESTVSFAVAKKERDVVKHQAEVQILDEKDDPEPIIEGRIDLGELVAQHISLAIPSYPHKEGVKFEVGDEDIQLDAKSPLRKNPFEALKDWKEER